MMATRLTGMASLGVREVSGARRAIEWRHLDTAVDQSRVELEGRPALQVSGFG